MAKFSRDDERILAKYVAEATVNMDRAENDRPNVWSAGYYAGIIQGVDQVLRYTVVGTSADDDISERVAERANELVALWKEDDERLNGEYTVFGGGTVTVERCGWDPDQRYLSTGDDQTRAISNTEVLSLVVSGMLRKVKVTE